MNDFWNDPPEDTTPEWWAFLEDALAANPPEDVAKAVRKAMDDWSGQQFPQPEPEDLELPDDFFRETEKAP